MSNWVRGLVAVLGAAFAVMIVWASTQSNLWDAVDLITSDPWGQVTLADLYLGFVLTAVVIGFFERGWMALFWIAPMPFLGNVWAVIWFVVRWPELVRRLRGENRST